MHVWSNRMKTDPNGETYLIPNAGLCRECGEQFELGASESESGDCAVFCLLPLLLLLLLLPTQLSLLLLTGHCPLRSPYPKLPTEYYIFLNYAQFHILCTPLHDFYPPAPVPVPATRMVDRKKVRRGGKLLVQLTLACVQKNQPWPACKKKG